MQKQKLEVPVIHATIGLIIAWLWFTSQIGHSLLIDLLIMWEPK
jgi:hypothetical protein